MNCHYVAENIMTCSDQVYVSPIPLPITILILFGALFAISYLAARYVQTLDW